MTRILAVAILVVGCAKGEEPVAGAERGACYGNGTCNDGLRCLSNLCVRPPPADCAAVAEALVSLELGNYAPREERAARVANLAGRCLAQHVTKDEGACLVAAQTSLEATFCPKPLIASSRGVPSAGMPPECTDYVRVLERYAACTTLPPDTRAALRANLAQLKASWSKLPPGAMAAPQVQACAQGRAAIEQGMRQMGCP